MEALDKIFIHRRDISFSEIQEDNSDIEYIRKDVLLKKIDEAIVYLADGSLTGYYESLAYKDIRELIESM